MPFSGLQSVLILLATIISLLLWPVFLVFIFFNEMVRTIISMFLMGSKFKLIGDSADNFWCCEGGFYGKMVVIVLISPDGVDLNTEREAWMDRVFKRKEPNSDVYTYAKFKKVATSRYGYGCWRDHAFEFDIRQHVKIFRDDVVSEEEFYESIVPRLSENMSEAKPQWEWLLIPRMLTSQGKMNSVRVLRFHHAYMDGVYSMLLFGECLFDWMNKDPSVRPPFILDPKGKTVNQDMTKKLVIPKILAGLLLPVVMMIWGLNLAPGGNPDPFGSKRKPGKRSVTAVSEVCPRNVIRRIGGSEKIGLPSAVACAMRPALRKLLKCRGIDYNHSVVRMNMTHIIPPYLSNIPRNQVAIIRKELPLSDSIEWKDTPPGPDFLMSRFGLLLSGRMPNILLNKLPKARHASCLLTSAPFTRELGTINGALIETMVPFTLLIPPFGFGIVIIGYGDKFRITITADETCISRKEATQLLENVILDIKSKSATDTVTESSETGDEHANLRTVVVQA